MKIKSIRVQNFRSILDETLYCDKLTALVGANGSGKSSFLSSLELFQRKNPKITKYDFYNQDKNKKIEISITFTDLSDNAIKRFSKYIQNGELTIDRVFYFEEEKPQVRYHGSTLQNPEFDETRNYTTAAEGKEKYAVLKLKTKYNKLPNCRTIEDVKMHYLNGKKLTVMSV